MTVTPENVVQTRDIGVWEAPYSAAATFPANSAWGTSPGGTFRDMGATDGGVNVNIGIEYEEVTVDQLIDPVLIIPSGRNVTLEATLAEPTAANLNAALGGNMTLATTAASSGVRGYQDADLNPTLLNAYKTVYLDMKHPGDGEAIRILAWKAQGRGSPNVAFAPGAKATIPFTAQAFPDGANSNRIIRWRDVSAALP